MEKLYYTERLVLRIIDKTDAPVVLDYYSRNKEFLEEWEAVKSPEFYTIEYQENQLDRELKLFEEGNSLRLWLFKKGDISRAIGCIAFSNIVRGAFLSCHLGYKLDKDEINNGFSNRSILRKPIHFYNVTSFY